MRNKLKLSLIAIATLVAGNTNAQTYYSCIPEGCPAGKYFDGKKCLDLPTGSGLPCFYHLVGSVLELGCHELKTDKGYPISCKSNGNYQGWPYCECYILLSDGDGFKFGDDYINRISKYSETSILTCNNGVINFERKVIY